jgi:MFS transporter, ACS family, hexuronate transporter
MPAPPEDSSSSVPVGSYRWVICALLFLATAINYIDRQVFSILAPELQGRIGWSEIEYGYIVLAFQTSYAIGLAGVGSLMDRLGTRRGYSFAIAFWSLASIGHSVGALGGRLLDCSLCPRPGRGRQLPGGGENGRGMVS